VAGNVGLHDLIGSVAGAIVDAQGVVERHFLDLVGRYFDSNGRPISFDIKLPKPQSVAASSWQADEALSSPGGDDYVQLGVPLLSLVESNLLAIKEMTVDLDVELGDIITSGPDAASAPGAPGGAPRDVPAMSLDGDPAPGAERSPLAASALLRPRPAMGLSVGIGGRTDASGPTARISIKVEAKPVSEGLLRLLTQLNKVV
jgi:hypothetical protein